MAIHRLSTGISDLNTTCTKFIRIDLSVVLFPCKSENVCSLTGKSLQPNIKTYICQRKVEILCWNFAFQSDNHYYIDWYKLYYSISIFIHFLWNIKLVDPVAVGIRTTASWLANQCPISTPLRHLFHLFIIFSILERWVQVLYKFQNFVLVFFCLYKFTFLIMITYAMVYLYCHYILSLIRFVFIITLSESYLRKWTNLKLFLSAFEVINNHNLKTTPISFKTYFTTFIVMKKIIKNRI